MTPIPHSRPTLTAADSAAVAEVLAGPMIGQGRRTAQLERSLAHWIGAEGAVGAGSGSAALQIALHGLGAGPGGEVVVPTLVCRSVLEAVIGTGARPVPCDTSGDWVVTAADVRPHLNARTRAVIVPHVMGIFADSAAIVALGAPVVEDFAQALPVAGTRRLAGEAGVFSFHPTKCITAGEGGAVAARSAELLARMRDCRDGAQSPSARVLSPLSDIAAALAASQLEQYTAFHERRRQVAERYWRALHAAAPAILRRAVIDNSTFFRFPVVVRGGLEAVVAHFAARGITVRTGADTLLHRLLGLADAGFPAAVAHYEHTVSLPIYPALADEELDRCIDAAVAVFAGTRSESPEMLRQ